MKSDNNATVAIFAVCRSTDLR